MAYINGNKVFTIVETNGGGGGTNVVANPQGTPTADLETIQIENTIYKSMFKYYHYHFVDVNGNGYNMKITKEQQDALFLGISQQLGITITTPDEFITAFNTLKATIDTDQTKWHLVRQLIDTLNSFTRENFFTPYVWLSNNEFSVPVIAGMSTAVDPWGGQTFISVIESYGVIGTYFNITSDITLTISLKN